MVQKESHTARMAKSSHPNLMPTEFAAMAKKRIDEFVDMQTESSKSFRRQTGNGSIARNPKQTWLLSLPRS